MTKRWKERKGEKRGKGKGEKGKGLEKETPGPSPAPSNHSLCKSTCIFAKANPPPTPPTVLVSPNWVNSSHYAHCLISWHNHCSWFWNVKSSCSEQKTFRISFRIYYIPVRVFWNLNPLWLDATCQFLWQLRNVEKSFRFLNFAFSFIILDSAPSEEEKKATSFVCNASMAMGISQVVLRNASGN